MMKNTSLNPILYFLFQLIWCIRNLAVLSIIAKSYFLSWNSKPIDIQLHELHWKMTWHYWNAYYMQDVDFNEILSERNVRYDAVNLFKSLQTIVSDVNQYIIDCFILMPVQCNGLDYIKYFIYFDKLIMLSHFFTSYIGKKRSSLAYNMYQIEIYRPMIIPIYFLSIFFSPHYSASRNCILHYKWRCQDHRRRYNLIQKTKVGTQNVTFIALFIYFLLLLFQK